MAVVASDTFNRRNQGVSTDESVAAWLDIAARARAAGHARAGHGFGGVRLSLRGRGARRARRRAREARRGGAAVRDRARRHDRCRRAGAGRRGRGTRARGRAGHTAALSFPQYAQHGHRQCVRRRCRGRARRSMRVSAGSAAARSHRRQPAISRPRTSSTCSNARATTTGCRSRRGDRDGQMAAASSSGGPCRACSSRRALSAGGPACCGLKHAALAPRTVHHQHGETHELSTWRRRRRHVHGPAARQRRDGPDLEGQGLEHAARPVGRRAARASTASAGSRTSRRKQIDHVMHGTTIATNTVLTGTGARVGLVTTQGLPAGAADRAQLTCRAVSAAGSSTTSRCRWRRSR